MTANEAAEWVRVWLEGPWERCDGAPDVVLGQEGDGSVNSRRQPGAAGRRRACLDRHLSHHVRVLGNGSVDRSRPDGVQGLGDAIQSDDPDLAGLARGANGVGDP